MNSESKKSFIFFKTAATAAVISIWAFVTGYYQIFSVFAPYDDEGYLMMTVKQFLAGGVLYDEIYTQYGPAYYLYKWLIQSLTQLSVTHDITRFTTLVMWVLTALSGGLLTYRLTRSALAFSGAYIFTFLILFRIVNEPGHPQELCGFLLITALLLLTGDSAQRKYKIRFIFLGTVLAFLCLTKINLGIFLGLALAITFLQFTRKGKFRNVALISVTFLTCLLPFILFYKYFSFGWEKLSIVVSATILSAFSINRMNDEQETFPVKYYLTVIISFLVTILLITLFVILKGTTPQSLINGILLQNFKFGENFYSTAPLSRFSILLAIISVISAVFILYFNKKQEFRAEVVNAILKVGFGSAVILISLIGYYHFYGSSLLLSYATPFLWLLLINQPKFEESPNNELPYTALVFAAILQPLQIFPIPGTQMAFGTFLMIIVGVLCLRDGSKSLFRIFPSFLSFPHLKSILIATVIIMFAVVCGNRTAINRQIYTARFPLGLSGANRLRLPEREAAGYQFLAENLRLNCDDFISMPGLYSLNFWSGIEPPNSSNATAWMTLLDADRQQEIIEILKSDQRVCAIYQPQLTENGLRDRSLQTFPLAAFILNNFKNQATVEQFEFMTLSDSNSKLQFYARFVEAAVNTIEFQPGSGQNRNIARIQIVDLSQSQIVADSLTDTFTIVDEENQILELPVIFENNPDRDNVYKVKIQTLKNLSSFNSKDLLLRLIDDKDQYVTSIPFLEK